MYNSLEQQIATARRIFVKMPDQLFEMYIRSLINDMGNWPFHSCFDFTYNTPWHRIFSVVSLHEQANCFWKIGTVNSGSICITQQSLADITQLLQNYDGTLLPVIKVCGFDYAYSKRSTGYHIQQLQRFATYNLPVVIYPIAGKWHILDGNHRIGAALRLLNTTRQSYSIPAWIAEV